MLNQPNRSSCPFVKIQKDGVQLGTKTKEEEAPDLNKREILTIEDNIFVAINFGLANCIMIEGEEGVIIIDTMESPEAAREVLAEFRRITAKPIVAIILTHFHADHVNGMEVFLEDAQALCAGIA